jgi:hypothetical protein
MGYSGLSAPLEEEFEAFLVFIGVERMGKFLSFLGRSKAGACFRSRPRYTDLPR